jgi:hypothetical protein
MKGILRQVTLDRASRRKDKSISITFITELEETSQDYIEIDQQLDQRGVLYFKPSGELTQKELDEIDNVDVVNEGKSKSQRLRNVLYITWQQLGDKYDAPFETYYADTMEYVIGRYKSNLD